MIYGKSMSPCFEAGYLKRRLYRFGSRDIYQVKCILSIGDEAIVAGTVLQMQQGDALALDYRGTAALVMRGVDLASLLNELLGQP